MIAPTTFPKSGIYVIQNVVNGKVYVGSAANMYQRYHNHKSQLSKGVHHNPHLSASWMKYGPEAFRFWVAESCGHEELLSREQWWLDALMPYSPAGYNHCRIAGNTMGRKHSASTRKKIRAKALGRTVLHATRAKISALLKGKPKPPRTDEQRRNMSAAKVGKKVGPMSDEHKAAISAGLRGRRLSEETKAKIAASRRKRSV